ncbi:hypothetical protein AB0L53_46725 [Nonomuraea sp. NPDC052129]|uniref:hypothetical protein n=1 Tax=Nonomuraea sp. NPDC052129 TaxID=3154651 RepID=UPI003433A883
MSGRLWTVTALVVAVIVTVSSCDADAPPKNTPKPSAAGSLAPNSPPSPSQPSSRPTSQPTPWAAGRCLDVQAPKPDSQVPALVDCAFVTAGAQITKLVYQGNGPVECPKDSDGLLDTPAGQEPRTACLRNRRAPHPGDVGKGGGLLRVGDCTLIEDDPVVTVEERACYDAHGPGRIRSFTKTKKACTRKIWSYAYKWQGSYVCVGPGEDAKEVGPQYALASCLTAPKTKKRKTVFGTENSIVGGLKKVSCKLKKAWGKVVGHVSIEFECRRPADYSVTSSTTTLYGLAHGPDPYPAITCIRRL